MTASGLLPDGDERHLKALEAAWGVEWDGSEAVLAAYHRSLAEQGARFVEVSEVAKWLRHEAAGGEHFEMDDGSLSYALWSMDEWAEAFLRRFGGGDEG